MSFFDQITISAVSELDTNHTIHDNVIVGLTLFEIVLLTLIVGMSTAWFIYYTNYALLVRKKIRYLKYCADSYPIDRIISSQVEYCRSQLISAILFSSIIGYLCLIAEGVYLLEVPAKSMKDCTLTSPFNLAYDSTAYRILLSPSSVICSYVTLSLLVILTSYLHKAYGTSRAIILTENKLFVWMCIEVGIILLIHVKWKYYILFDPVITLLGVIKLYLFFKHSNRLLHVLKTRYSSAINEPQKQLANKKKLYLRFWLGARALFIYALFYITTNGVVSMLGRIRLVMTSECVLTMLFGFNFNFQYIYNSDLHSWRLFFRVSRITQSLFYIILLLLLLMLHMGLFQILICQLVRTMCCRQQKKKKKHVTFANDITQPFLPKE